MTTQPNPSIYHFSTHTTFGAAIAARRLHDSLVDGGVPSTFFYRYNNGQVQNPTYIKFPSLQSRNLRGRVINRLIRLYSQVLKFRRPPGFDPFRIARLDGSTPYQPELESSIIHLHFIADMLDYASFFGSLPEGLPIVWTLHDMNPITGGCHYSWGCEQFKASCGNCPQLNSLRNPLDLSRINILCKNLALNRTRIHFVANSRWLEQQARESAMARFGASFQTIHCGVDVDSFRPLDRALCRKKLGIGLQKRVLCFGAESMTDPRKGIRGFLAALRLMKPREDVALLSFGSGSISQDEVPFQYRHLGRLNSATELAEAYSASDLFVIPSIHEAFGQTSLEAMSCGIPVVGFSVGGIPDMIKPNHTGQLVEPGHTAGLARAISDLLLNEEHRTRMGRNARSLAVENFSLTLQRDRYLQLYRHLHRTFSGRSKSSGNP